MGTSFGKKIKIIICLVFCFLLFLFIFSACKHGSNQNNPDEEIKQHVENLSVFYGEKEISQDEMISYDYGYIFESEKLKIYYKLENEDINIKLDNYFDYTKVSYEDYLGNKIFENEQLTQTMVQTGTYKIEIDFGKTFQFTVKINQLQFNNLTLTLSHNNFEFGNLKKDNFTLKHEDETISQEEYICGYYSVDQYFLLYGNSSIDEVLPQTLDYHENNLPNLDIGEYYVCTYLKETQNHKSAFSNICQITIYATSDYSISVPKIVSYTFPTYKNYDQTLTNQTFSTLEEQEKQNNLTNLKLLMEDDSEQFFWNGLQNDIAGNWAFSDYEPTEKYMATDGNLVDISDIITLSDFVTNENDNKYIFVEFIPSNPKYQKSSVMLVKLNINKGKIQTPDNFYVSEIDDTSGIEHLIYDGLTKILHYSFTYSNGDEYAIGYFNENNQSDSISGKLILSMINSNYEFVISEQLRQKPYNIQTGAGFKITNENSVLTIEWKLNPVEIETNISDYSIFEQKNIKIEATLEQDAFDTIENSCDFFVDNENVQIKNIEFDEPNKKAILTVEISSFQENLRNFNLTILPKISQKDKIVFTNNTKEFSVTKYIITEQQIQDTADYSSIQSLSNEQIFKDLNKHFDIEYKKIDIYSQIIDENYATNSVLEDGDRLLLELTPKNEYFAQALPEGRIYVLEFSNTTIKLLIEATKLFVFPSFEPYFITGTYEEQSNQPISGNIQIQIGFDLEFEDSINNICSVQISGENVELLQTSINNKKFVLTIKISDTNDKRYIVFDVILAMKPAYQNIYELTQESESYVIERKTPENITENFNEQTILSSITDLNDLSQNYNIIYYCNDEIFDSSTPITQTTTLTAVLTAKHNKFFFKEKTISIQLIKN